MIDLSNNNGQNIDFHKLFAVGQRRVYLKVSEGANFADQDFNGFYRAALANGFKIGCYHFARPSQSTPSEEADWFLRHATQLVNKRSLRHCLDLEDPNATVNPALGGWAGEFMSLIFQATGWRMLLYGYGSYLQDCSFHKPVAGCKGIWLANYGRNDGKEYPFTLPAPFTMRDVIAHQYASTARVPGVPGQCDISRVLNYNLLDVTGTVKRVRFGR